MNALSKLALIPCLVFPLIAQDTKPVPASAEKTAPEQPKMLKLGERLNGALTLPDIDGKTQKAHDLMGKVTVVNFYSTECPIQKAWDKRLAAIQKDFESQGVVFLHIDSNQTEIGDAPPKVEGDAKPYEKIRSHLKANELPFRVLVDHGNKIADIFEARTTPHVYVFTTDGKLVYKGAVDDDAKDRNADSRKNYLRDVLGKLTKNEKVEPFTTKEEGCTIKRVKAAMPEKKGEDAKGKGEEKK